MNSPIFEPEKNLTLVLPEEFETLNALPDDPDGAISYSKVTSNALCFIQSFPLRISDCMPMNEIRSIVDGIHSCLADNQGIIEVSNGTTKYDKKYAYSIIKNSLEPRGMSYILTMHIIKDGTALCLRGQFEEQGMSGQRDAYVYEYAIRCNIGIGTDGEGWFKDPFDNDFVRGLRMNYSEDRRFDESFPDHPLSQVRALISFIIENN